MGAVKRFVKKFLKKSKLARKIVGKLYKIVHEGDPKLQVQETAAAPVLYPLIKETPFNKRVFKYLLSKENGYGARRWVVEQMFYENTGRFPNLDDPHSLNEKIQWMRFNYHDPMMTRCVDKCSFKDYIRETVGEEYVVPLYGVWNNVNDIDFDALPDRFAIKSTWGWGDLQNILVRDKSGLDVHKTRNMLNTWLQPWNNYYYQSFEWDSKDIEPRILAEQLLVPTCGEIIDYKFYCYNGKCRHFLVCKDRKTKTKYINYDLDFNCIKLSPNSYVTEEPFDKPATFDEMLAMAEKLAAPFPLVRVDFYDVDGKLYVGELTFSPGGGFNTYYEEWDNRLGDYLVLPEANADPMVE